MNEERRQILEILASGKITADEAERLIAALEKKEGPTPVRAAKFLRVVIDDIGETPGEGPTKVNVRVPMQLLKAGVKLAGLIPDSARRKINERLAESDAGFDLSQVKPENLEELIENLNELTVDVDDQRSKVRIFCE